MDDVVRVVKHALAATTGECEGTAVLSVGDGYLQWLGDHDGVRIEVFDPVLRPQRSRWRPRRHDPGIESAREAKAAALAGWGFIEGDPNFERQMSAQELGWEPITEVIVAVLRDVLGARDASSIAAETW